MSILGALYAGEAGLAANSNALGIISDNIANANTIGYKENVAAFSTLVTEATSATQYNPGGVQSQAQSVINQQGILQSTSSGTDLALSGGGFFVVNSSATGSNGNIGATSFTRAGSFTVDANGNLKNTAGQFLQGQLLTTAQQTAITAGNVSQLTATALSALQTVNVNGLSGAATATQNITLAANLPASDTSSSLPRQITAQIFDSQGNSHSLTLDIVRATPASANAWGVFLPSTTTTSGTPPVTTTTVNPLSDGSGTPSFAAVTSPATNNLIRFNSDGSLDLAGSTFATPGAISITYTNGATTQPLNFKLGTDGATDGLSQFGGNFSVTRVDQDGQASGNFSSLSIDSNGIVTANFDNGAHKPIFMLPIATFPNPNGLTPETGNTYLASNTAGTLLLRQAGTGSAGTISPSTLEGSTVDIATEFSNLIVTQRAYSANAKIITTADQMLQELIDSKR